jgi:mono/diheme cytochrome c family protein
VRKVFSNHCVKCHGAENPKGDFQATSYELVMRRGDDLIIPRDGEGSHLYRIVNHDDEPAMPPGGKKIPNADLKKLKKWIDDGALEKADDRSEADQDPANDVNSESNSEVKPESGNADDDDLDPFK